MYSQGSTVEKKTHAPRVLGSEIYSSDVITHKGHCLPCFLLYVISAPCSNHFCHGKFKKIFELQIKLTSSVFRVLCETLVFLTVTVILLLHVYTEPKKFHVLSKITLKPLHKILFTLYNIFFIRSPD